MLIYCIESSEVMQHPKRNERIALGVVMVWVIMLISNFISPWFYVLPQNNVYRRLPLFWMIALMPFVLNCANIVICFNNFLHNKKNKEVFKHLVVCVMIVLPGVSCKPNQRNIL